MKIKGKMSDSSRGRGRADTARALELPWAWPAAPPPLWQEPGQFQKRLFRRKRTDWQGPPLGNEVPEGPRPGCSPPNTRQWHTHTWTRTGTHTRTHERGNPGTHTCTCDTTCTHRERIGVVSTPVRKLLPGKTLFVILNCFRTHYCTIRNLCFSRHKFF